MSAQADPPNGQQPNPPEKPQNGNQATKTDASSPKEKPSRKAQKEKDKNDPAGGFDSTPIPSASSGYTIKFTFHRAENLPMSDLTACSTDAYIHATLTSGLQKRHKEDPDMILRTHTIHKSTDPKWESVWVVAGVPASGFRVKCRLYDEDPSDHDDRLGNVTIHVNQIDENWQGMKEQRFDVKKRMASKRAYLLRGCRSMVNRNVHMGAYLFVSMEMLGESEKPYGRMYTIGETYWFKHFSPMIGRLAGTKAPESQGEGQDGKPQVEKYDFQANQMQLQGPVPAELYHRFVEFKPFVKGMFSNLGLRGRILNKALHHQHARVYNFSGTTLFGKLPPRSRDATLQFLRMVHYDEGGRIFTYILSLDGLLRFTETGKEFGVDLLSKHTMHSDVNIYIACSGEFFIRRLKHPNKSAKDPEQESHPNTDLPGGPPHSPPPKDPRDYELVIDNDSGTYRPKGSVLPLLKTFLKENFPGLHIVTKECTDKELEKWKSEQKERKKKEGNTMVVMQGSDSEGDISSSEEEELTSGKTSRKRKGKNIALEALENPTKVVGGFVESKAAGSSK